MNKKIVPFSKSQIEELSKQYPTPFHIYDEKAIVENAKEFISAFNWAKNFKNYFAVKALPNPEILKILKEIGFGADCSSLAELLISEKAGVVGKDIMLTSNDTPAEEFKKARELGAIVNFDDITHVRYYEENVGALPETVCFRYNPGALKGGNEIIGTPEESKYGLTTEQILEAYTPLADKGVKSFGIHTMVASNEINVDYFVETAVILFELVAKLKKEKNITIDFIDLGGGIGIPYKPEQDKVNIEELSSKIKIEYEKHLTANGLEPKLCFECGRFITGPYGYLVTKAIHKKDIYKNYIGVDSCMANLMRPALYGSYHHITVLGKEDNELTNTYDVVGSLCENNDKFAINRKLPKIEIGDTIVIHDTGAHGHAMGFNYNGKLRSAEFLLKEDGSFEMIRRAETLDDLFATLNLD